MPDAAILSVEDLHVAYGGVQAVRGISLEVRPGEITALLGANGAGKSSTLLAIVGSVTPKSGRVTFDGERITGFTPDVLVRRGVALIPEGGRVFARQTVEKNLRLGAYVVAEEAVRLERIDRFGMLVDTVFETLADLNRSGTSILLVEQNMVQALELATRAYVMQSGRIALSGTAQEISTSDEVRRAYLGL